jgi:hypothetical protein
MKIKKAFKDCLVYCKWIIIAIIIIVSFKVFLGDIEGSATDVFNRVLLSIIIVIPTVFIFSFIYCYLGFNENDDDWK